MGKLRDYHSLDFLNKKSTLCFSVNDPQLTAATATQTNNRTTSSIETENTSNTTTEYASPITNHLRSHLTALRNLRHGFIEQHGSEPSVSLRYSQQSTSNSTISLRVGDEMDHANYVDNDAQSIQSTSGATYGQERNQEEVNNQIKIYSYNCSDLVNNIS